MMSRFLLLFCFATLHVLGNQVSSTNNELQPVAPMPQQNQPVQHSEADIVSTKEVKSAEAVSVPAETDKTITKSEESSNNTQSLTDTPASSTTGPSNSKAIATSITVPASTIVSISTNVTTTTPKSTTTKPAPPTTKPAPPTTKPAPTTTTPTPTTTSSPDIVSTTPSTPVVPPGTPGKWIVNGTTKVCVVLQMAVSFNVSYDDVNHTISYKTFDMPIDNVTTTATGSCGSLEDQLTLTWSAKNINNGSMTLHFVQNDTTKHYSLHHLEVVLSPADFPNGTFKQPVVLVHNESNFIVGVSNSYRCLKQQKLDLKRNDTKKAAGYLSVSGLQFQAFKADNSTVFGLAKDCAFETPDVVPIAVGCTLTGLVIVVLISYLVARRRNQAHGYLSM